jgi:predicted O-methyltransferase YrrM
MSLLSKCKAGANKLLTPFNLRIETLNAEQAEMKRLRALEAKGHFQKPVFPVLSQFTDSDPRPILAEVARHEGRFSGFAAAPGGDGVFSLANDYFNSPDAEVLYAMVCLYQPRRIIEVGSGNSTLLFRQAISDAGSGARLVSIDPQPRREIARYTDEVITDRVENVSDWKGFFELNENDILFIDSSHEVKAGNDVLFLLLRILPVLKPGVLIHLHDIFLPYEYPREWLVVEKWNWAEQYLAQALLQNTAPYDVLWAGHYLQRHLPDFKTHFVHLRGGVAKSLWLRKR